MPKHWIDTVEELSNEALTVEAQTVPIPDQEVFLGEGLFPAKDVDKTSVDDTTVTTVRSASERREWDADGVKIEKPVPTDFKMNILPLEGEDSIGEEENQKLAETGLTVNQAALRRLMRVEIPNRITDLALANLRRLEKDRYVAWLAGEIRQRNPQNRTQEVIASFPWKNDRIQTAGTPWTDSTAYDEFIAWAKEGVEEVGSVDGFMLRQRIYDMIKAGAPYVTGNTGRRLVGADLLADLSEKIGTEVKFIFNRTWYEPQGTKEYYFPIPNIGLVPAGGAVGDTLYAPVVRAIEAAAIAPEAGINIRGQAAYREVSHAGKRTTLQVQLNAAPKPVEKNVWVMNTGVVS